MGDEGEKGCKGDVGMVGEKGNTGVPGAKGEKGDAALMSVSYIQGWRNRVLTNHFDLLHNEKQGVDQSF